MSPFIRFLSFTAGSFFALGGFYMTFVMPYETWKSMHGTPIKATVDRLEQKASSSGKANIPENEIYVHFSDGSEEKTNVLVDNVTVPYAVGSSVTIYKTKKIFGNNDNYVVKNDYKIPTILIGFGMGGLGCVLIYTAFMSNKRLAKLG